MSELTSSEINERLRELPGWSYENNKISKTYTFGSFREAVSFIVRISYEAEEQRHHPEIANVYSTVEISLNTHDAGNIVTEKDINLATAIEKIAWLPQ